MDYSDVRGFNVHGDWGSHGITEWLNFDADRFCNKCGRVLEEEIAVTVSRSQNTAVHNSGLKIAARVLLIIGSVCQWFYVALGLFMIAVFSSEVPNTAVLWVFVAFALIYSLITTFSTVHYNKMLAQGRRVGIGFKIFVLLFAVPIAGILMICDKE